MIDRDARNRLSALIRQYLTDGIKAFALDEALDEFRFSTDPGVQFVANNLWYHYDDCVDHRIVASKPEWDYFQRLLLLLESNSTVSTKRHRQWSAPQIVAAIALAIYVFVAFQTGIGPHLFIFFAPLGLCSIAISYFRRYTRGTEPYDKYLVPFASIRDLRIAYTAAPSFRKTQYPKQLAARRVRSPMFSALIAALRYVMWAVLAPIPLLAQCYPTTFTFPRVKHGVAQK